MSNGKALLAVTILALGIGITEASASAGRGDGPPLVEQLLQRTETAAQRPLDAAFRAAAARALSALAAAELQERLAHGDGLGPLGLGDSNAQLVYTPVAPCRVIDTRVAGGSLASGTTREFRVSGGDLSPQGGNPAGCGVPHGRATNAIINFVAVRPAGSGHLEAWAYSTPPVDPPLASILNYASVPGLSISNGIAVPLCDVSATLCTYDLRVRAVGSGTHLVADVVGFFERFPTEEVPSLAVPRGAVIIWDQSATCPEGYTRAGNLDGRFLRGAGAPGATGGSEEHRHDIAHNHGLGNHTHDGTTSSGGADHTHLTSSISFFDEQTISTGGAEVGFSQPKLISGVGAFGTGDLVFLRGFAHNHDTGGASAFLHTHAFLSGGPSTNVTDGASSPTSGPASSLPPYLDVLFCRKN